MGDFGGGAIALNYQTTSHALYIYIYTYLLTLASPRAVLAQSEVRNSLVFETCTLPCSSDGCSPFVVLFSVSVSSLFLVSRHKFLDRALCDLSSQLR